MYFAKSYDVLSYFCRQKPPTDCSNLQYTSRDRKFIDRKLTLFFKLINY